MKYEYGFELDFDKISNHDISKASHILFGLAYNDGNQRIQDDEDYVWWNPLGNYVSFTDGGHCTFYFCKNYLRVTGYDLTNKKDRETCFEFLKQISKTD